MPIRNPYARAEDAFRADLAATISALETWAWQTRDAADIEMATGTEFWKMAVAPRTAGACPFELLLRTDQTFSLRLDLETYEDRPVETFSFFADLVRALAAGRVERIETLNAMTATLERIEMRVIPERGKEWIGERALGVKAIVPAAEERRTRRFLAYRR